MHPEIRKFPSRHFYNNMLEDGESVKVNSEIYTFFREQAELDQAQEAADQLEAERRAREDEERRVMEEQAQQQQRLQQQREEERCA